MGTRKSLLAVAQSSWVARELERLNPGIKIELVGIETTGDKVLDKPLSQIEGKEFFTAELDQALMRGDVDFTVHSMKDLALERPPQIKLAATPPREFAHDLIIFDEKVIERIRQNLPVRVGTSSPRRLTLVPEFLRLALPRFKAEVEPILQFVEIRGNVNTRLSRIHEQDSSEKKLDAVVLAFAGLERLAIDEIAVLELNRLFEGTRKMVLPLRQNPSAPAQGALAIEARTDDVNTLNLIAKIHDEATRVAVTEERKILAEWGGGCHLKLGASFLADQTLLIRGQKPSGEWVNETRGKGSHLGSDFVKIEASDVFDFVPTVLKAPALAKIRMASQLFIAHPRAFSFLNLEAKLLITDSKKNVWVSGMKSWVTLAHAGVWVEGSVEGAGFKKLAEFETKKVLGLNANFLVLSHDEAQGNPEHSLSSYQHKFREIPDSLKNAQQIFWSSGLLFRTAWSKLGAEIMLQKKHASGPGKTAEVLIEHLKPYGVEPHVFTLES